MLVIILCLAAGLACLYYGAEWLVRGARNLALRMGISSLVVGLTVVAFGTSAPELVVSINAGLSSLGNIAVGNVVGSNIANILMILGISACIFPMKVNLSVIRVDTPIMIAVSGAMVVVVLDGVVSRVEGLLLFAGIVLYTVMTIILSRRQMRLARDAVPADGPAPVLKGSLAADAGFLLLGLAVLVVGSKLFVRGAVDIAHLFNISEAVIGLTIVAMGTSLPELATSIVAALKRESDIAIGNVVGSNIFNVLSIMGISSVVTPLHCSGIGMVDLATMCAAALLLLPFLRTGFKLDRWEGAVFVAGYGTYLWYLWP